ncbi:MAG: signal peptidase I [Clostridia bacterium]|nr:signal peptidase I [Clostridia bacterium]
MARYKRKREMTVPSTAQIEAEILREKYNRKYRQVLKSTLYSLIVVAAIAVLTATLALPVLQISGSSMEPTLNDEEVVVLIKTTNLKRGELCCFSYQNKLLIKRVIGLPGDIVNVDAEGFVYVNGNIIDEPYVVDRALGESDITYPCHVTENHYFVLGDHRSTSVDSRSSVIGLVSEEYIVGKIFFRVWPFDSISTIK